MSESTETKDQGVVVIPLPDKINIEVGYGEGRIQFYLKMISVLEETEHLAKFATTPDDPQQKAEAEYAILVDAIATWSYRAPTSRSKNADGIVVTSDLVPGATSPREAVETFFGKYSIGYERILNTLLLRHRVAMSPTADFF